MNFQQRINTESTNYITFFTKKSNNNLSIVCRGVEVSIIKKAFEAFGRLF